MSSPKCKLVHLILSCFFYKFASFTQIYVPSIWMNSVFKLLSISKSHKYFKHILYKNYIQKIVLFPCPWLQGRRFFNFLKYYSTTYEFFIKLFYAWHVNNQLPLEFYIQNSERDRSLGAMREENKASFILTKRAVPNCFSHALNGPSLGFYLM